MDLTMRPGIGPPFQAVWVYIAVGAVGVLFLGVLLWKIILAEEGFLLGYGKLVFGKWGASRRRYASAGPAPCSVPAVPPAAEPERETDRAALERDLEARLGVLTLSRLLDGDIAYLMVSDAGEWESKIVRALQMLVSGVTRVVRPAGQCRCGFFILDDTEEYLVLAVGEGYRDRRRPRLALEGSCAGRAFLTGEDYYCRNIDTDPVYATSEGGRRDYRSIACVPVRAGQLVFGVICLDAPEVDAFTPEDFEHLEIFAAKAAVLCAFHTLQQAGVCSARPEGGESGATPENP